MSFMGSATLTGILQRVEVNSQSLTKERRIPWFAVMTVGVVITLCFIYGCWQHFVALQVSYENQKLETVRRGLTEQRERLMLDRASKESDRKLLTDAEKLGLVTRTSALGLTISTGSQSASTSNAGPKPTPNSTGGAAPND